MGSRENTFRVRDAITLAFPSSTVLNVATFPVQKVNSTPVRWRLNCCLRKEIQIAMKFHVFHPHCLLCTNSKRRKSNFHAQKTLSQLTFYFYWHCIRFCFHSWCWGMSQQPLFPTSSLQSQTKASINHVEDHSEESDKLHPVLTEL